MDVRAGAYSGDDRVPAHAVPDQAMTAGWGWPDSLDAVIAAPNHHRLVFENDRVRVLDTLIPAGDTAPIHTHRWPAVYYTLQRSDFVRRDGEGKVLFDSRTAPPLPSATFLDCLPP